MGCTSSKPTAGAVCVASNKPVGTGEYEVDNDEAILLTIMMLCASSD